MNKIAFIFIFFCVNMACHAQETTNNNDKFYAENILEFVPTATIFALKAAGVKSEHSFTEQLITTAGAYVALGITVETLKHTVHSERPDHTDNHGFPSGHAAVAFAGADILFCEYRDVSPWIGIGGYAVATTTAVLRVTHDRHHWADVIAGAAIGVGSSRLSQWLSPKIFHFKRDQTQITTTPCLYDRGMGLDVCLRF